MKFVSVSNMAATAEWSLTAINHGREPFDVETQAIASGRVGAVIAVDRGERMLVGVCQLAVDGNDDLALPISGDVLAVMREMQRREAVRARVAA